MSFRPPKTLPILSIFHHPPCKASRAALQLLEQKQKKQSGEDAYRIDVVDYLQTPPTPDQLQQVASYLPKSGDGTPAWRSMVRSDAQSRVTDWPSAQQLLKDHPECLERPIVVDWSRGHAALGRPTLTAVETLIGQRLKR